MTKNMPTVDELRKMTGVVRDSVSYNESRSILNNLNVPVIAYGIGYGGFVFVVNNRGGKGFMMAYSYMAGHPHCRWSEGGFRTLTVDKALEIIREDTLFVKREIDEEALAKSKVKTSEDRPVVAKIVYDEKNCNRRYSFKIERYKNGNYLIREYTHWDRDNQKDDFAGWSSKMKPKYFIETYERYKNNPNYELVSEEFAEEDFIQTLKMNAAVEEL